MKFLLACLFFLQLAVSVSAQTEYSVLVGGQGGFDEDVRYAPGLFSFNFYPAAITINAGDSIRFRFGTISQHTVSYTTDGDPTGAIAAGGPVPAYDSNNGPYTVYQVTTGELSSGARSNGDADYVLQFPNNGTFSIFCAFHPGMAVAVTVNEAGTAAPSTPSDVALAAWKDFSADEDALDAMTADAPTPIDPMDNKDGSQSWTVWTGFSNPAKNYHALRFYPAFINISVGDTVIFNASNSFEPHVVSFHGTGYVTNKVFPNFDAVNYYAYTSPYTEGTPYDGESLIASAFLANEALAPSLGGNVTWSIKFDKAGTFQYICPLHVTASMVGVIYVQEKESDNGGGDNGGGDNGGNGGDNGGNGGDNGGNGGNNNNSTGTGSGAGAVVNINFGGMFNGLQL